MVNVIMKIVYNLNTYFCHLLSFLKSKNRRHTIIKNCVSITILISCSCYTITKDAKAIKGNFKEIERIESTKRRVIGGNVQKSLNGKIRKEWMSIASHPIKELILQVPSIVFVAKRNWVSLQWYATTVGTGFVVAKVAKTLLPKKRPDKSNEESFPSGHGVLSGMGAVYANINWGFLFALPMYFGTIFIGAMRVIDKKHYPIDVVSGIFIGAMLALHLKTLLSYLISISGKGSKNLKEKLDRTIRRRGAKV